MSNLIRFRKKNIHGALSFLLGIIFSSVDVQQLEAKRMSSAVETKATNSAVSIKPSIDLQTPASSRVVLPKEEKTFSVAKSFARSSKLSLDQIYALSQEKKSGQVPTRSQSITPAQKGTDLYTQSQAHMSVPEVKKLIAATYDTKPYEKLIKSILDREKEYADYYVFYHGLDNVWRVPQDLYTRLYAHFNKISPERMKDFIVLRFNGLDDVAINDFLIAKTEENGLINDHRLGDDVLAVNLALFGNVGSQPECTWQYFIKSRGHEIPTRATYETIMNKFGLSHKYINDLMKLVDLYKTKEETILQIFVPKDKINQTGYLAWIRGIPADQELMHMVLRSVEEKKFDKTASALAHYSRVFREEREKNPIYKSMIAKMKTQEFSLDYFLTFYRNRPNDIEDINAFQARLFFTHDVLLNPDSGVKIFRCSTTTDAQLKKYHEKLDGIVKKMIAEKQK